MEQVVRHHASPVNSLRTYDVAALSLTPLPHVVEQTAIGSQLIFRPINPRRLNDFQQRDTWVQQSPQLRDAIAVANELAPIELSNEDITDLVAFLKSLTDPRSRDQSHLIPQKVPSGLPVDR